MHIIYYWADDDNIKLMPCMIEDIIYIYIYTFSIKRKFIVLKIRREEETVEGKGKKKLFLSRFMNEEKKKEWTKEE